jgi:hypothetical protein
MIIDYQMEIDDSKQYVATTEKESLNEEDFIPQFRDETHHVRKLFADSKLSSNNFVSTGLCFISVINICFSNIGVKCEKCQRTYQKFITNRVFDDWNGLPKEIVLAGSTSAFKSSYDAYKLGNSN